MTIRVSDNPFVVPGYMIRSMADPNKIGVVVFIDYDDDDYTSIWWTDEDRIASGFYGNKCSCEYVTWIDNKGQENNKMWYDPIPPAVRESLVARVDHARVNERRPRFYAMLNT